ncbi:helix-hairpin-helix domain-containing protein [Niallia sp. XMNu-256]|uniref:helix-hairpin-helix domain-containing protein n=1 Tax=Niallia sp. XMNu-256 TaxID=3082444 RepID=UPI0030D61E50
MKKIVQQNKLVMFIGFLVIGAIVVYYIVGVDHNKTSSMLNNDWMEQESLEENETDQSPLAVEEKIVVDVKGAVHSPGVYECQPGDRVKDVIERAGGLLEHADQNSINLAMKLEDEMVLYFPVVGEEIIDVTNGRGIGVEKGDGKININKASQSELQTLTGIGPSKADAIIEFREQNGPFKAIEDLKKISGIGEKTFEKLKDEISI